MAFSSVQSVLSLALLAFPSPNSAVKVAVAFYGKFGLFDGEESTNSRHNQNKFANENDAIFNISVECWKRVVLDRRVPDQTVLTFAHTAGTRSLPRESKRSCVQRGLAGMNKSTSHSPGRSRIRIL